MTELSLTEPAWRQYGVELHAFLDTLPAALKSGRLGEAQKRCETLLSSIPNVDPSARWAQAVTRMQQSLGELSAALARERESWSRERDPAVETRAQQARAYVLSRYEEAMRAYEQWVSSWRQERVARAEAPTSLAPLIGARTIFHMAMASLAILLYSTVLTRFTATVVLLALLAVFGTLEISRRFSERWNQFLCRVVFGPIARPRELYKTNSATWYLLALCIVVPLFSREAVVSGLVVLGFGDPAAAWIGKRWGNRKLYRNKSYAGTLGFVLASLFVGTMVLFVSASPVALSLRFAALSCAAIAGAGAELLTTRLDDNFTVPVAAVLAASLLV